MIKLVINADDFGEFRCVSAGILECVEAGSVSATGVMSNSPLFAELAKDLKAYPQLDCGVHLNLSRGVPLTASMAASLQRWNGVFPGKAAAVAAVAAGRLSLETVEAEWRAQIERALEAGLTIRFLNAHEHVHLWPSLRRLVVGLAQEYGIPWVRKLLPDFSGPVSAAALCRNLAVGLLQRLPPGLPVGRRVDCLGLGASGSLDAMGLRRIFERLPANGVFELMCHPGRLDRSEVNDPRLLAYHDWERERQFLCSSDFVELCASFSIELTRFSDMSFGALAPVQVSR